MGAWKTSKPLTDKSWAIVKDRPALAGYPVRASIAAVVGGAILAVPGAAIIALIDSTATDIAGGILVFLGLLLGSSLAMIEMGALVVAADRLLNGQEAAADECRAQARQHTGALVGWALLNLIVGSIIQAIQGTGSDGVVTTILRTLLAAAAAAAWALITFFMLPLIVLEGLGTMAALKRSAALIKERFGKAVFGGIRIGFKFFLILTLPGLLIGGGGVVLWAVVGGGLGMGFGALAILVGLALILVGTVLTATVKNVFGVALYRWTATGEVVGPFTEAELGSAVKQQ
jgi:hypothetical protein